MYVPEALCTCISNYITASTLSFTQILRKRQTASQDASGLCVGFWRFERVLRRLMAVELLLRRDAEAHCRYHNRTGR
jgi:hypothetical protein